MGDVWRLVWPTWEETSGEHRNRSITSQGYDCSPSCVASLGLGNPAGAEILEGDVWGALKKIEHAAAAS